MTYRRILVTGAAGFVGGHMLARLRAAFPQAAVVAAARPQDAAVAPAGADRLVAFDLLRPDLIRAAVDAARPDACVHLAAHADVGASFANPDAVWAANVDGTRALAAALLAVVPACVLLHASSAEVYGLSFQSGVELDEDAVLRPANPYAASKAAVDVALGEMALRGLRVLRMRPLNHVGPGQGAGFAVAAFARQIALIEAGLQEPVIRTGALDRARDFLDVRDVCAAYAAALARAGALPGGIVFNVASGVQRRVGEVLAELLALSGVSAAVETANSALRPVDVMVTRCDATRARRMLDWAPEVVWADTLAAVLADWRRRIAT